MSKAFAIFNEKSLYGEDWRISRNVDIYMDRKMRLPIHPEQQQKSSLQKNGVSVVHMSRDMLAVSLHCSFFLNLPNNVKFFVRWQAV